MAMPVAVVGGGSFGTCLAIQCALENDVVLWARDAAVVDAINREHRNPRYLRDFALPEQVRATLDLEEALRDRELVVLAVPSQSMREVMGRAADWLAPGAILVSTAKGIEEGSGLTMHQVLEETLPPEHHARITCLSGPSFAREIAAHKNTVVTVACREEAYAIAVQTTLSCPWFRCYTTSDVLGVELGGALKNVVAIAVGVCDGMDLGLNARAATMTRGLAEITRLGVAMGADPLTFLGLSGMGDLLLTCTGDLSRNRHVGLELGKGRKLDEILAEMGQVAEGVRTTHAACELAKRVGVELPIAEMGRQVLEGECTPAEAAARLMTRQLGSERLSD